VDAAFLASNMLKLLDGGWFPLAIGASLFTLMMTWNGGRRILSETLMSASFDLPGFLESLFLEPPVRVAGTAVFLTAERGKVPKALLHNLKHNKVLHENNFFVTIVMHEEPWIPEERRLELDALGRQCWSAVIHYGFKDEADLPQALWRTRKYGCAFEEMTTSYFVSRDTIVPTVGTGMAPWREKLFAQMHHNASGAAGFLGLPNNAVVELGSKIEI
jgi:KUP system potassium uptake protein